MLHKQVSSCRASDFGKIDKSINIDISEEIDESESFDNSMKQDDM